MRELNNKELIEINGGDEPAFGLGYLFGKAVRDDVTYISCGLYIAGNYLKNLQFMYDLNNNE